MNDVILTVSVAGAAFLIFAGWLIWINKHHVTPTRLLKSVAVMGIAGLTVFLAGLNTFGAWHASNSLFWTGCVLFIEVIVSVTLALILMSPSSWVKVWKIRVPTRKIIGAIIFAIQVYITVENGKVGVMTSLPTIFTSDSDVLEQQAELLIAEADQADARAATYRDRANSVQNGMLNSPDHSEGIIRQREEVLSQLELSRRELEIVTSDDLAAIQRLLKSYGRYSGEVDGLPGPGTDRALSGFSVEVRQRIERLETRLSALSVNQNSDVFDRQDDYDGLADDETENSFNLRRQAIQLRSDAEQIEKKSIWLYLILLGMEGTRSFGLWAFVLWDEKHAHMNDEGGIEINGEKVDPDEVAFAWQKHKNQKEAAQKGAQTRERNARRDRLSGYITDDDFIEELIRSIDAMRAVGMNITEMAKSRGQSRAELMNLLKRAYSQAEIEEMDGGSNGE